MAKAKKAAPKTSKSRTGAKKTRHAAKRVNLKSSGGNSQFLTVQFTEQSLYWMIFGLAAILFAAWVYTLDARVRDLYDQIDRNAHNSPALYEPATKKTQVEE